MAKPLLFITGFLGAGKTTLLRGLLRELRTLDRTADVILNDFENAEIDASTLPGYAASIFPIAASCACCDSLEDLVKLCLAARKSKGDVLLIELNGTADPLPLLETFTLLEEKMPFFPRLQVGVVDARDWGRRGEFAPLERRQIETATHWLPSHLEQQSNSEVANLMSLVSEINPHATKTTAAILARELAMAAGSGWNGEDSQSGEVTTACPSSTTDHEHRLSHRFTGYQILLPGRFREDQIVRFLEALPPEVVRAKLLVRLKEEPGPRWLFERSGNHPVEKPRRMDQQTNAPASLVCIGPNLAPATLKALVSRYFGL